MKIKLFFPYFLTISLALLFYFFEFIPDFSEAYYEAHREFIKAKKINTLALKEVKIEAQETSAYKNYIQAYNNKKKALSYFNKQKKEELFLGFESFHFFIERFGFFLAIFFYSLYNLYTSFRNEPRNTGAKIVHSFIISVCFFYFYWIFQQFQDVSKITYYFMTFASAFIVTLAVYLITQYRKDTITQLKRKLFLVSKSALLHTPIDKKEKLYQEFKDIAKE
ncbi:hypothetical protein [Tenacibaculum sp. 190524A02b]|uniref:hypothetical protein n=1 Tax=Tenacibaculum vairaonense TaxID=3137860 RepID=UPI0031FAF223